MDIQKTTNSITIPVDINSKTAGFWLRLGAFMIDMWSIWGISIFFYYIFIPEPDYGRDIFPIPIMLPVGLVYHTLTIGKWGRGLGKFLGGILVVTRDRGKVSYTRSFARALAWYISALIVGIGYLMVIFSKNKRALHDYIVGTMVIYKKQISSVHKTAIILFGIASLLIAYNLFETDIRGYKHHFEKSRIAEALSYIAAIKSAQERYYAKHKVYAEQLTKLDINFAGMTDTEVTLKFFIISISTLGCSEKPCYIITATRHTNNAKVKTKYGQYAFNVIVPDRPYFQISNCPGGSNNCDELLD
jgi:uncharacterized RDD family membrane protein YckC/Tfp pilus assembly protein PilE